MRIRLLVLMAALALPLTVQAQTANPYLNAAMRLYGDFEYDKALEQLKKAQKFEGNTVAEDLQIAMYSGLVKAELGNMEDAASDFKEALALDPNVKLPGHPAPKIADVFNKAKSELAKSKPAPILAPTTTAPANPPVVTPPPPVVTPPAPNPTTPPQATVTEPQKKVEIVIKQQPQATDVPKAEPKLTAVTPDATTNPDLTSDEVVKPAKPKRLSVAVPIAFLVGGAAIGGGAAYFGNASSSSVDQARAAHFQSDAASLNTQAHNQALAANAMYGVAGVALLVGVITLFASQAGD